MFAEIIVYIFFLMGIYSRTSSEQMETLKLKEHVTLGSQCKYWCDILHIFREIGIHNTEIHKEYIAW